MPANSTNRLQPLDISVKKPVKEFLRVQFHDWYSCQVCSQLDSGSENEQLIDLRLTIVKPLGATWLILLINYLQFTQSLL